MIEDGCECATRKMWKQMFWNSNTNIFTENLEKGPEEMDLKIIESLQFHKENSSIRSQAIINVSKSFELLSNASKLNTSGGF